MFKITWASKSDRYRRTFVLVPDVYALFTAWHIVTGYGRDDGCSPVDVQVTSLDGQAVDMAKGMAAVASLGTYAEH